MTRCDTEDNELTEPALSFGPILTSEADALVAFREWVDREHAADRPVTAGEWRVWTWLARRAFDGRYSAHAGRGAVTMWHSDIYRERLSRATVERALKRFRAGGLVQGKPCAPDPEHDWHRDRARYVLRIPVACVDLVRKLAWRAKRKLADLTRSNDASTLLGQRARSHLERDVLPLNVCIEPTDGLGLPVDRPPGVTYPDDYRQHRQAFAATKGKLWNR